MYHSNPACIKSLLLNMPDAELLRHARYIRRQILEVQEENRVNMFLGLYRFVLEHCRQQRPRLLITLLAA